MGSRIGIFGGTFNPIHIGHLISASEVLRSCSLDGILFMPARIPPHKQSDPVVRIDHRVSMIDLAICSYSVFSLSLFEATKSVLSYSIDTVQYLSTEHPEVEYYFIMGMDSFREIHTWHKYILFLDSCRFIITNRGGYYYSDNWVFPEELEARIHPSIRTNALGIRSPMPLFRDRPLDTHRLVRIPNIEISSSEIRRQISEGEWNRYMVPASVYRYIVDNRLYRSPYHRTIER